MKDQYKWDFKDFFHSDEDFLTAFACFKKDIVEFKDKYEKLSLEEKLSHYYALSLLGEKLITYSELHSDLDLKNETYLGYKNEVYTEKRKVEDIKGKINEDILKIEISLEEYRKSNPKMKPFYMHFYDVFRLKEHTINNIENLQKIFAVLGLEELAIVDKTRKTYFYLEKYEVALDCVKNLGYFIEIEVKNYTQEVMQEYDALLKVAKDLNLNLNEVDKRGYSYYLIENKFKKD